MSLRGRLRLSRTIPFTSHLDSIQAGWHHGGCKAPYRHWICRHLRAQGSAQPPLSKIEIMKNLLDLLGASPNRCFLVGPVLEEALEHLQIKTKFVDKLRLELKAGLFNLGDRPAPSLVTCSSSISSFSLDDFHLECIMASSHACGAEISQCGEGCEFQ